MKKNIYKSYLFKYQIFVHIYIYISYTYEYQINIYIHIIETKDLNNNI